jgi:hypothetical protein
MRNLMPNDQIEKLIFLIRGHKVMLDADLARLYGATTKALNQAVKRNHARFPKDFAFQLTPRELDDMMLQIAMSKTGARQGNRSQFVTGSQKHRDPRFLPHAFTEHGALMAANVLNSQRAVQMSVYVIRAFVRMRQAMVADEVVARRLAEIEKTLLTHDVALQDLYARIRPLLLPPPAPTRRRMGFSAKEPAAVYGRKSL